MVYSMTGYGRLSSHINGKNYVFEIRSLNSKGMEIQLKIPQTLKSIELEIRKLISDGLERGKVEFSIQSETSVTNNQCFNEALMLDYITQLKSIAGKSGIPPESLTGNLFSLPGVISYTEEGAEFIGQEENVLETVNALIVEHAGSREKEGDILKQFVSERFIALVDNFKKIEPLEQQRIDQVSQRIRQHLTEWQGSKEYDHNRFEQEMIYYLEKLDISEEKSRLSAHIDYFLEVLNDNEKQKGKKLGFIAQEIGREINTLGSKANDAAMQKLVVMMKDELEKIKEQSLNIL